MPTKVKSRSTIAGRLIHVKLEEDMHRRLRVRVAELDTSIQDYVTNLVAQALRVPLKSESKG